MRNLINIFVLLSVFSAFADQPQDTLEKSKERVLSAKNVSVELQRRNEYLRAIIDLKEFTDKFPAHPRKSEAQYWIAKAYENLARETKDKEDASRSVYYFKLVESEVPENDFRASSLSSVAEICEQVLKDTPCKQEALVKLNQMKPASHDELTPIDLTEVAKENARNMQQGGLSLVKSVVAEPKGAEFLIKIELDQAAGAYTSKFLSSAQKEGMPSRFYVDIDKAKIQPSTGLPTLPEQAPVSGVRLAQNTLDKVRLVLDLSPSIKESDCNVIQKENSIIVNIKNGRTYAAAVESDPISIPKGTVFKKKTYRIIVDPGHGGDDVGAKGMRGSYEKDVCLNIALRLRELLRQNPRYEILMTRETDKTLMLSDRTKFANKMQGDLFVSIHANASPKRTAKGVSTYFLHNADDQESLRVAMRENGELAMPQGDQPISEDHYLEVMKASMVKNFHTIQSTDLARQVQAAMLRELKKDYKDIHDLGVRSARFYVLTGAEMPAVLVETSFISNPQEEKRLTSASYQGTLAQAIVKAVDQFFKIQEKAPAHAGYSKDISKRNLSIN